MRLPRRAGRRTNAALLWLLAVALATGWVGYGVGTASWSRVVAVVHALAGLGLLVLLPWKALVVRRAWRRGRMTGAGAGLALLVVASVAGGVAHSATGWAATRGLALQVHVGAAILAAGVLVAHVARHPGQVRRVDLSRRGAVRAVGVVGGAAAVYAASHGVAVALDLPGAAGRTTGSTEVGSGDPRRMPVTQWLADTVPDLDRSAWRLAVRWPGGERLWTYDDLLAAAHDEVAAVIDCTGGWYAVQGWRGVRLDRLLPEGVGGRSVRVVSATGYARRLPLPDARSLLLATHCAGAALSRGHGAPVRLVAPGRRGFWWVKWVVRLEVSDRPWWWQPPLPLR